MIAQSVRVFDHRLGSSCDWSAVLVAESPTRLAARMPLRRIALFKCLAGFATLFGLWLSTIAFHKQFEVH
eukprot:3588966-Amphidinium_carterae.1